MCVCVSFFVDLQNHQNTRSEKEGYKGIRSSPDFFVDEKKEEKKRFRMSRLSVSAVGCSASQLHHCILTSDLASLP